MGAHWVRLAPSPMVITGEQPAGQNQIEPPTVDRPRLSVDLSPVVMSHLDHISEVTGVSKAGIITGALLDALPELLARADGLKKRHNELSQAKGRGK